MACAGRVRVEGLYKHNAINTCWPSLPLKTVPSLALICTTKMGKVDVILLQWICFYNQFSIDVQKIQLCFSVTTVHTHHISCSYHTNICSHNDDVGVSTPSCTKLAVSVIHPCVQSGQSIVAPTTF